MESHHKKVTSTRLVRYIWLLAAIWTVLFAGALIADIVRTKSLTYEFALQQARDNFLKDLNFRAWVTSHGGVYVPVDDRTPPNPYLAHVPERDVVTPAGVQLTLMNPAYVTRQLYENQIGQEGIQGHLTSLKPLNPKNAADPWEREALLAFEQGETEAVDIIEINGESYFRLMRPFITEAGCLKCHAEQGYQVGDIRGGISASVPMTPFLIREREHIITELLILSSLWAVGVIGLVWSGRRLTTQMSRQEQTETALQASQTSLAKAQQIAHLGNWEWHIQTDESTWSDELCRIAGITPQQFGKNYQSFLNFIHPDDREKVSGAIDEAIRGIKPYSLDCRIVRADGIVHIVYEQGEVIYDDETGQPLKMLGTTQDVTEQKEAEAALQALTSRLETLIQSLQSGILMEDAQRKVALHNEAFNGIFGLPPSVSLVGGDCVGAAAEMKAMFNEPEQFIPRIAEIIQQQQPVMGEELSVADGRALERDYVPVYTEGQLVGHLWHYRDVTERVRTREQIKASLQEKEVLLKEIHHRVKNNLQIVASLLYLQSSRIHDPATLAAFQESSDRIRSMSLIHEQLYQSKNLAAIDFHDYLSSLVAYLSQIYRSKEGRIDVYVQAKDINLEIDTAVTLGLIINELVSNALKHAFPNSHNGRVDIQLTRTQPNTCTLTVRDNGIGFAPDAVERLAKEGARALYGNSLGIKLVDTLTQQINGEIAIHSHNGTLFEINFPLVA